MIKAIARVHINHRNSEGNWVEQWSHVLVGFVKSKAVTHDTTGE